MYTMCINATLEILCWQMYSSSFKHVKTKKETSMNPNLVNNLKCEILSYFAMCNKHGDFCLNVSYITSFQLKREGGVSYSTRILS
jgi:hypothetical protein